VFPVHVIKKSPLKPSNIKTVFDL